MNALSSRSDRFTRSTSRALKTIAILGAIALSGCATTGSAYHSYIMQGQVLSVEGNTLTICIGERNGAEVDQLLDVVRHVRGPSTTKSGTLEFRREEIGEVRIASLIDEHYATAEVIRGEPKVNDTVELERQ